MKKQTNQTEVTDFTTTENISRLAAAMHQTFIEETSYDVGEVIRAGANAIIARIRDELIHIKNTSEPSEIRYKSPMQVVKDKVKEAVQSEHIAIQHEGCDIEIAEVLDVAAEILAVHFEPADIIAEFGDYLPQPERRESEQVKSDDFVQAIVDARELIDNGEINAAAARIAEVKSYLDAQ